MNYRGIPKHNRNANIHSVDEFMSMDKSMEVLIVDSIGVFDINVRTLFLPPYECNQLAFPHVDRSRYYLLFDIDTFPKFPLVTFIGGLEVMKPLMFFSPHIWPILSTLIS